MADLDQRLEKVKFRLKGVSLVARFAMVAILESSDDAGVWLREGTGSSATCFIFDADGFQQKFASVEALKWRLCRSRSPKYTQ